MTISSQRRGRRRFAAVALALTVTALAACSRTGHNTYGEHDDEHGTAVPSGASTPALPPLPAPWTDLDRTNPQTLALAAVNALFDWRPGTVHRRGDRPRAGPAAADPPRRGTPISPTRSPARSGNRGWTPTPPSPLPARSATSSTPPTPRSPGTARSSPTFTPPAAVDLTATTLITLTEQPAWTVTAVTTLST